MTEKEVDRAVGEVVRNYSKAREEESGLFAKLHMLVHVFQNIRTDEQLKKFAEREEDPREEAKELLEVRKRRRDCESFLRTQGLDNLIRREN